MDIAKFGQLYLQKGIWNGKQLVPAEWIAEATSFQTSNGSDPEIDWDQGYGYQFWRCRHNAYRGDGAFGQYCIVMPEQDAVLAITSGTKDMQAILNLVWQHLLPAMQSEPLEDDEESLKKLQDKLSTLALSIAEGEESSDLAATISGRTYEMEPNDAGIKSILFELAGADKSITLINNDGNQQILTDYGELKKGTIIYPVIGKQVIASSGAWTSADTYLLKMYLYQTPFYLTMNFTFKGDEVKVKSEMNVSFGQAGLPPMKGMVR